MRLVLTATEHLAHHQMPYPRWNPKPRKTIRIVLSVALLTLSPARADPAPSSTFPNQSGCSHREHLHIYPARIHQRQPLLPQVVEPLLDFPAVESAGTLLSDRRCSQATRMSAVTKCSSIPMIFTGHFPLSRARDYITTGSLRFPSA